MLQNFKDICKVTIVTHTKRIDRNLLRKETSFVCLLVYFFAEHKFLQECVQD